MKSTWDTLIEPVAVELTSAGQREAERIKNGLLSCGCYADACYCGQYPTREELLDMQADPDADRLPMTDTEATEAEELRNFFGGRHDH